MEHNKAVAFLFALTLLSACGGGGGGGGATSTTPPPIIEQPPAATIFGGLWFGDMVIDAAMGSEECGALITEDGQFRFLCAFTDLQLTGMSSRNMNSMTGSGLAFSSLGFLDGAFVSDLTVQATLVEKTSLVGTWSTSAGDTGSFNMVYDVEYETPSSLAPLEGVWEGTDELGNPNATFTIDNLGSFTAQNSEGCTSSGMFLILDDRYDLVQVNSTIVGCSIAGDYSGLALVFGDVVANDTILVSINSDQRALLFELQKTP